jgi:hypothetical protein
VQRSRGSQDFVSPGCNNLEINKTYLVEKKTALGERIDALVS